MFAYFVLHMAVVGIIGLTAAGGGGGDQHTTYQHTHQPTDQLGGYARCVISVICNFKYSNIHQKQRRHALHGQCENIEANALLHGQCKNICVSVIVVTTVSLRLAPLICGGKSARSRSRLTSVNITIIFRGGGCCVGHQRAFSGVMFSSAHPFTPPPPDSLCKTAV